MMFCLARYECFQGLLFPPSEPSAVDKVKATIDAAGTSVITQLAGEVRDSA